MPSENKHKINIIIISVSVAFILLMFSIYSETPKSRNYAISQESKQENSQTGIVSLEHGGAVYLKEKKIEITGVMSKPDRPLEVLACGRGGKDYESLVVLDCKPQNIHLALILFGLKEGKEIKERGDCVKSTGDIVLIIIEWEKEGKTYSYRAEDLIIDTRTKKPWPRLGWSFTGSTFADEIDPDTGEPTGRKIYQANVYKTIVATYNDPDAILNNPTKSGGFGTGNLYLANKELTPQAGTPLKIIIRVPTKEELSEIKKTTEEFTNWETEWLQKAIKEQEEKRRKMQEQQQSKKDSPEKEK